MENAIGKITKRANAIFIVTVEKKINDNELKMHLTEYTMTKLEYSLPSLV